MGSIKRWREWEKELERLGERDREKMSEEVER
jgi:hypothetical protein